ncbi:CocE/NonD family hydrolase [Agromyces aerolatus]|nr:CocE/NonD family hydrolase [Agromyces sp. LY-1358]
MAFPRIIVDHDVPVPMRDGVILAADVYRPDAPGPHPVLLSRLPYGKHRSYELSMLMPTYFARQGDRADVHHRDALPA